MPNHSMSLKTTFPFLLYCRRSSSGRFHQTLCAKRKFARAQQPAKKTPFNFINNVYANYISRNSPNLCTVCRTPFTTKSVEFCKRKRLGKIVWQKFGKKVAWKSCAHILVKLTPRLHELFPLTSLTYRLSSDDWYFSSEIEYKFDKRKHILTLFESKKMFFVSNCLKFKVDRKLLHYGCRSISKSKFRSCYSSLRNSKSKFWSQI